MSSESSTSSIIRMELLNKIPGKGKEKEPAQEEWRNVNRKSKHSNVEFGLLDRCEIYETKYFTFT